jgi:hypothetical protein
MSNAWDRVQSMVEKASEQNGNFVRFGGDGDKHVGAFVGDPHAKEVHWTDRGSAECSGENCAHCKAGTKKSLRILVNFYVPAVGAMKIIEGNNKWFETLTKVRVKYGLDQWLFEVERHGDKGDPKTTYSILPEKQIDEALAKRIAEAKLHDLRNIGKAQEAPRQGGARGPGLAKTQPAHADAIDPAAAGALVAELKLLPRADLDAFLAEFGVQKVRDLREEDEGAARAFIADRKARVASADAAAAVEVDPFQ